jgi:SAM-dependent methyltransferase
MKIAEHLNRRNPKSAAVQPSPGGGAAMPAGAPAHNYAHNYATDIEHQREVWKRKPALRAIYSHWYAQCVEALAKHQPTVEVGCGSGNFKAFYRESIATDVLIGTGAELVADAMALPLAKDKTGNIVAFDVIHHLQRPLRFLRQAMAVLKPGGRLVLCEPAMSLWSKLVFRYFHHEPFDLSWPLFDLDGRPPDPDPGHSFSNQAIPEILFWKERERTLAELGACELVVARKFGFLLYPLSGGFSAHGFLPCYGLPALMKAEDWVTRPFSRWLSGMRMLIVLEKTH